MATGGCGCCAVWPHPSSRTLRPTYWWCRALRRGPRFPTGTRCGWPLAWLQQRQRQRQRGGETGHTVLPGLAASNRQSPGAAPATQARTRGQQPVPVMAIGDRTSPTALCMTSSSAAVWLIFRGKATSCSNHQSTHVGGSPPCWGGAVAAYWPCACQPHPPDVCCASSIQHRLIGQVQHPAPASTRRGAVGRAARSCSWAESHKPAPCAGPAAQGQQDQCTHQPPHNTALYRNRYALAAPLACRGAHGHRAASTAMRTPPVPRCRSACSHIIGSSPPRHQEQCTLATLCLPPAPWFAARLQRRPMSLDQPTESVADGQVTRYPGLQHSHACKSCKPGRAWRRS